MDLREITDIQQLKAMAYDELQRLEVAKQNVQMINQRLAELEEASEPTAQTSPKPKNKA